MILSGDTVPHNNHCPRDPLGADRNCGNKKRDKTLGAEIFTDIVVK